MIYIQKSTPMRLKGTHFINLPGIATTFFDFFLSLLNEKLRSRIQVSQKIIFCE
jgi:CRAL/TRIO domain